MDELLADIRLSITTSDPTRIYVGNNTQLKGEMWIWSDKDVDIRFDLQVDTNCVSTQKIGRPGDRALPLVERLRPAFPP